MTTPKKHHFVPVWYLERFAESSGMLSVYDLRKKEWRKQNPAQVMHIRYHNRQEWASDGIDKNILEKRFCDIENSGKTAIEKLIATPENITADNTAALLTYLELQRIRVPRQAALAKGVMKALIHDIAYSDTEIAKYLDEGHGRIIIREKESRIMYMRAALGSHTPYFARMHWAVCIAPQDVSFVTTDSPVCFFNPAFSPESDGGIGLAGTMVLFPLSSTHLLVLTHPEFDQLPVIPTTKRIIADPLQDGSICLSPGSVINEDLAWYFNKIIAALAERIVVANSKYPIERSFIK